MRKAGYLATFLWAVLGAGALAGEEPGPTLEQVGSALVEVSPELGLVQLEDGAYSGDPYVAGGAARPTLRLLRSLSVVADFDQAPGQERAVLLSESTGGSGERIYLAVFARAGEQAIALGTVLVGDRVKLRAMGIEEDSVVVDVVEAGPRDAACCATQLARQRYRMEGGALLPGESEVQGTLSLETIAGIDWALLQFDNKPLAAGATAPTIRFEQQRVSGFGGCNRFHGAVRSDGPGRIELEQNAIASTRMACAEPEASMEQRYLAALAGVESYTFLAGRLALGWRREVTSGVLLFDTRPAPAQEQ